MKLSSNQKLVLGGVGAWFAFSWLASRVVKAGVSEIGEQTREAVADAYHELEDDARAVFDAWQSVYIPPFEVLSAALYALSDIAQAPGNAIGDLWDWWRNDYDPDGVTPEEPPFDANGDGFSGRGASGRF